LFIGGIVLTTLTVLACGLTRDFQLLALFRFLSGLGGAGTFICGGVLAGVLGMRAIVIFFSGGGIGMLLTGATLPWLFESAGATAWPLAWLAIGGICVPLSIASVWAAREIAEPSSAQISATWDWGRSLATLSAYFLFGLGYIAYMTFIVAWLKASHTIAISLASATSVMWCILGAATLAAPRLWRRVFDGRSDGKPMGLALTMVALSAGIPLLVPNIGGAWCSALLMGASVFMVPSAVTSFVKISFARSAWGHAMAVATTLFALGQAIGPVATGWISDLSGSLSTGLGVSVGILMAAALIAFIQKPIIGKNA
jgi:MFS family permease